MAAELIQKTRPQTHTLITTTTTAPSSNQTAAKQSGMWQKSLSSNVTGLPHRMLRSTHLSNRNSRGWLPNYLSVREDTASIYYMPRNVLGVGDTAEISTVPALRELTSWNRIIEEIILTENHRCCSNLNSLALDSD